MFKTLLVERKGGVATVTLNRPEKKNALNTTMWDELGVALVEIGRCVHDRVLVLTGAGDAFCSGADLSELPDPERDPPVIVRARRAAETLLRLHHLPKPTLARVNGVAVGAGANLALGCDLVVASTEARFLQSYSRIGLTLDAGGSWLLPRMIGLHKAKELAFFGDPLPAPDAEALGLVNKVVRANELDDVVAGWASRLADGPAVALSLTKALLDQSVGGSMADAFEDEARCLHTAFSSAGKGKVAGLADFHSRSRRSSRAGDRPAS